MLFKLTFANLKQIFRNKQALFWSLAFPLIFTLIFGAFFGKEVINVGSIGIINNSDTQLSKTIVDAFSSNEAFKIKTPKDLDEAKAMIKKNDLVAAVEIPQDFGNLAPSVSKTVTVVADPGSSSANAIVIGILDKILTNYTMQAQGAKPIFTINQESSTSNKVTYFDFILAGLMGLALMNSAVQGLAVNIAKYRDEKILKRITTTPLPSWQFVVSEVLSMLVLNLLQISLLLAVGIYVFKAHIYGSVFMLYFIALLGAILFLCLGFVVAALTKTTEAAEGMATAVTIPMMFLGGVFFPLDALPKWLYSIVQYIPLAPLLRMIRVVDLEAGNPFTDSKNIIILLSWIAILLFIAIWRFKFTEE